MNPSAITTYRSGTHRTVAPEETLERLSHVLARCGITRCTSVTQLDVLGVPTYCAIRPDGLILQVSNGKGLTDTAARVSALMEAVEMHHAEHPLPDRLRRTCVAALNEEGSEFLEPSRIRGFQSGHFGDRFMCEWVAGEDLATGRSVWAPASAVYFCRMPALHRTNSNGLASGNHPAEATLHALYELIERDARARLSVDGKVRVHGRARVVDPASVDAPELCAILEHALRVETKVVLLWLESAVALHSFCAVLLNRQGLVATSLVNLGWGTHADKPVAAARAVTEAAQSRLTFIHGARDDILHKVAGSTDERASAVYRYFDALEPDTSWTELDERATLTVERDLESQLAHLVAALLRARHDRLVRFDLTQPDVGIPVVKVVAPTLRLTNL